MNVIVDLSSLLWKAILGGIDEEFGVKIDHEGRKVQVNGWQYGLARFVERIHKDMTQISACPSDLVIVEEGLRSKQLRLKIDSNYKGSRDSRPVQQYEQFGLAKKAIRELFLKLGSTFVTQPGVEADDIIAYLGAKLPNAIVLSDDGDLTQLVGVCNVLRSGVLNPNPYGQFPNKYITVYKALVGDSSDNISGALNFGPKAFEALYQAFGDTGLAAMQSLIHMRKLNDLAEDVPELKVLQRVIDSQDSVYRSYALARLYPEAVNLNGNPLVWEAGMPLLRPEEIDFPQLRQWGVVNIGVTQDNFQELYPQILQDAKKALFIPLDIEATTPDESDDWLLAQSGKEGADSVDVIGSTMTGLGLTLGRNSNRNYYFSVDHLGENNLDSDQVRQLIDDIALANPSKKLVIHNLNYELVVLKNEWEDRLKSGPRGFLPNVEDTMIMASYVDENLRRGLKACSSHYLRYAQASYDDTVTVKVKASEWNQLGRIVGEEAEIHYTETGRWITPEGEVIEGDVPGFEGYLPERVPAGSTQWLTVKRKMDHLTLQEVLAYGCDDTLVTGALYRHFKRILEIEGTYEVYRQVEIGAAYLTAAARRDGCTFNASAWAEMAAQDQAREAELLPILRDYLISKEWPGSALPLMDGSMRVFKFLWKVVHGVELQSRRQKLSIFLANDVPEDQMMAVSAEEGVTEKYKVHGQFLTTAQLGVDTGDWVPFQNYCRTFFVPNPRLDMGSPNQLADLLYNVMGFPVRLRNKPTETMRANGIREGNPKADDDCFAYALKYDCVDDQQKQILKTLRELKSIHTRRGLYIEPYRSFTHWKTGKIHPSLNQCATVTRRYTASSPNVQQLPSRGEGAKLRSMFAAHHPKAVVAPMDFSGQELRLAAEWSQDENMKSCYLGDNLRDIHSITGARIHSALTGEDWSYERFYALYKAQDKGLAPGKDAIESRKNAKPVNFGRQYDATAPTIALQLICFEEESQIYCDAYDQAFPGVGIWKANVVKQAHKYGYSITKLGARRHLRSQLKDDRKWIVGKAERQAPNFCIQGSGAEQAKLVMGKIWYSNLLDDYDFRFMFPVHDEIVFSIHKDQAAEVLPIVHKMMTEKYADMEIPVVSSVDIGRDFGSCVGLGESADPIKIQEAIDKLFAEQREAETECA